MVYVEYTQTFAMLHFAGMHSALPVVLCTKMFEWKVRKAFQQKAVKTLALKKVASIVFALLLSFPSKLFQIIFESKK